MKRQPYFNPLLSFGLTLVILALAVTLRASTVRTNSSMQASLVGVTRQTASLVSTGISCQVDEDCYGNSGPACNSAWHCVPLPGTCSTALINGGTCRSACKWDNSPGACPATIQPPTGGKEPPSVHPECSDGIDNDGDDNIDYPADPDCDSPADDTEGGGDNNRYTGMLLNITGQMPPEGAYFKIEMDAGVLVYDPGGAVFKVTAPGLYQIGGTAGQLYPGASYLDPVSPDKIPPTSDFYKEPHNTWWTKGNMVIAPGGGTVMANMIRIVPDTMGGVANANITGRSYASRGNDPWLLNKVSEFGQVGMDRWKHSPEIMGQSNPFQNDYVYVPSKSNGCFDVCSWSPEPGQLHCGNCWPQLFFNILFYGVDFGYTPTDPTKPTSTTPTCGAASGYTANLVWTGTPYADGSFIVKVSTDPAMSGGSSKTVKATNTQIPDGLLPAINLNPGVTYYVRISGDKGNSGITSFNVPNCCGNGVCAGNEGCASCSADCGTCASICENFACTVVAVPGPSQCTKGGPTGCGLPPPVLTLSVNKSVFAIPPNDTLTLAWTAKNVSSSPDKPCSISEQPPLGPVVDFPALGMDGSKDFPISDKGEYKFTLTCTGSGGTASTSTTAVVYKLEGGNLREIQ